MTIAWPKNLTVMRKNNYIRALWDLMKGVGLFQNTIDPSGSHNFDFKEHHTTTILRIFEKHVSLSLPGRLLGPFQPLLRSCWKYDSGLTARIVHNLGEDEAALMLRTPKPDRNEVNY